MDFRAGQQGHLGLNGFEPHSDQCIPHLSDTLPGRHHIDAAILSCHDVVGTCLQSSFHHGFLISARCKLNEPGTGKQISHRSVCAQITAALGKGMPHLRYRTIPVVRHHFHEHCHTTRRITLVGQLLHVVGFAGARPTCYGVIDGVPLHIGAKRLVYRCTESRVVLNSSTTGSRGHDQFPDQLGKELAPLGVLRRLAMLDVRPFTVARHRESVRCGLLGTAGAQRQFPQLLLRDFTRGLGHHALSALGFGEGDHVANRLTTHHQHDETVQTEGEARMGWCAMTQRTQQEPKLGFRLRLIDTQQVEHGLLHGLIMNTNGATANLAAVQYHIVGLRQCSLGLCLQRVHRTGGRREGVVQGRHPAALIAFGHPGEPDYRDAMAFIMSVGAKGFASRMLNFDPSLLTLDQTRRLRARMPSCSVDAVKTSCSAAAPVVSPGP